MKDVVAQLNMVETPQDAFKDEANLVIMHHSYFDHF